MARVVLVFEDDEDGEGNFTVSLYASNEISAAEIRRRVDANDPDLESSYIAAYIALESIKDVEGRLLAAKAGNGSNERYH